MKYCQESSDSNIGQFTSTESWIILITELANLATMPVTRFSCMQKEEGGPMKGRTLKRKTNKTKEIKIKVDLGFGISYEFSLVLTYKLY